MHLSQQQIKEYQNNGVIIIKDIFKDWIEPLRVGFQKVLDNPSKHGRENVTCLLYTSPSPRDRLLSRMPSSA